MKAEGKTEKEIDEILAREFPLSEYDDATENAPSEDAIRKKSGAANKAINNIIKSLQFGEQIEK